MSIELDYTWELVQKSIIKCDPDNKKPNNSKKRFKIASNVPVNGVIWKIVDIKFTKEN